MAGLGFEMVPGTDAQRWHRTGFNCLYYRRHKTGVDRDRPVMLRSLRDSGNKAGQPFWLFAVSFLSSFSWSSCLRVLTTKEAEKPANESHELDESSDLRVQGREEGAVNP